MNIKTSGWKFEKEKDIYIASKYCSINHLLTRKEKTVSLRRVNQVIKVSITNDGTMCPQRNTLWLQMDTWSTGLVSELPIPFYSLTWMVVNKCSLYSCFLNNVYNCMYVSVCILQGTPAQWGHVSPCVFRYDALRKAQLHVCYISVKN